jgi:hypothetical protein
MGLRPSGSPSNPAPSEPSSRPILPAVNTERSGARDRVDPRMEVGETSLWWWNLSVHERLWKYRWENSNVALDRLWIAAYRSAVRR